jgi:hypothetical protein
MTSAAFAIIWMKIQLEWHSIIFCSFGAVFGLVFGELEAIFFISPQAKKLAPSANFGLYLVVKTSVCQIVEYSPLGDKIAPLGWL